MSSFIQAKEEEIKGGLNHTLIFDFTTFSTETIINKLKNILDNHDYQEYDRFVQITRVCHYITQRHYLSAEYQQLIKNNMTYILNNLNPFHLNFYLYAFYYTMRAYQNITDSTATNTYLSRFMSIICHDEYIQAFDFKILLIFKILYQVNFPDRAQISYLLNNFQFPLEIHYHDYFDFLHLLHFLPELHNLNLRKILAEKALNIFKMTGLDFYLFPLEQVILGLPNNDQLKKELTVLKRKRTQSVKEKNICEQNVRREANRRKMEKAREIRKRKMEKVREVKISKKLRENSIYKSAYEIAYGRMNGTSSSLEKIIKTEKNPPVQEIRISPRTGKPVRPYHRKKDEMEEDDISSSFINDADDDEEIDYDEIGEKISESLEEETFEDEIFAATQKFSTDPINVYGLDFSEVEDEDEIEDDIENDGVEEIIDGVCIATDNLSTSSLTPAKIFNVPVDLSELEQNIRKSSDANCSPLASHAAIATSAAAKISPSKIFPPNISSKISPPKFIQPPSFQYDPEMDMYTLQRMIDTNDFFDQDFLRAYIAYLNLPFPFIFSNIRYREAFFKLNPFTTSKEMLHLIQILAVNDYPPLLLRLSLEENKYFLIGLLEHFILINYFHKDIFEKIIHPLAKMLDDPEVYRKYFQYYQIHQVELSKVKYSENEHKFIPNYYLENILDEIEGSMSMKIFAILNELGIKI